MELYGKLKKREVMEDVFIVGGLTSLQVVYALSSVLLSYIMKLGLDPLVLVIFSALASFIILSPFAFFFERDYWPRKFSSKLVIQLFLMSLGGVTLFQTLFMKGIKLTSPAIATAMPNLAPGLIFVIAWITRFEKVNVSCFYSKVKILGTVLCVVGAFTMSLMHSTVAKEAEYSSPSPGIVFDKQKIIGCLYLGVAVITLSCNAILQASALVEFPAPISMSALTSLIGIFTTAAVEFYENPSLRTSWPYENIGKIVLFSLLGGALSGTTVSFNGWAVTKRGPVLVSMFSPIGALCSALISLITLGETINMGSLAGMFVMFTGLYFVLWAKGKEKYTDGIGLESERDEEKALLS